MTENRFSNQEAERLWLKVIRIWESTLGPDHHDLGAAWNNLASLYFVDRRYSEAETLYQRALNIGEKRLGPEHPCTVLALIKSRRCLPGTARV